MNRYQHDNMENIMTQPNNERQAIRNLQIGLRQLSYFDPDIISVPIDGIFGEDTRQSVRMHQRKNGLPVTGIVDRETWDSIYRAYQQSLNDNEPPLSVNIFPRIPGDYVIDSNTNWFIIDVLQYMLLELGILYDELSELERTGLYDEDTEKAVRIFQNRNMLPETGKVDRKTWNSICRQHNNMTKDHIQ